MSSVYRILCLSHDPAITTEAEHARPESAEAAIASGIPGHPDCDLLIGRYSYPLIEVGCPPTTGPDRAARHRCYPHSVTEWVDVAWLRILAAVHQSGTESMQTLAGETRLAHWSRERLRRLRDELGIDAGASTDQPEEAGIDDDKARRLAHPRTPKPLPYGSIDGDRTMRDFMTDLHDVSGIGDPSLRRRIAEGLWVMGYEREPYKAITESGAESEPGTYWERAVLERFVTGGPVDLKTVRLQVSALLRLAPLDTPVDAEEPTDV